MGTFYLLKQCFHLNFRATDCPYVITRRRKLSVCLVPVTTAESDQLSDKRESFLPSDMCGKACSCGAIAFRPLWSSWWKYGRRRRRPVWRFPLCISFWGWVYMNSALQSSLVAEGERIGPPTWAHFQPLISFPNPRGTQSDSWARGPDKMGNSSTPVLL